MTSVKRTSLKVDSSPNAKRAKKEEEQAKITPEDFYRLEDDLSRSQSHSELRDSFLRDSSALKQSLMAVMDGTSKELDSSSLLLHVARMRRLSRLSQYSMAQLKKQNTVLVEQAEAKYLQLKNVNSEIQHLQKEIARCLQFSSGDEDIDLVPEEEFYANAPEAVSRPEVTREDEHERHLARLNWELVERKQLLGTLSEQEGRRAVLISDINGKEQRLKGLRPKIDALIKAAKPVQDVLGVQYTCTSSAHQRALFPLLPHQLAVLYVQAEAYKDIVQDVAMSISIEGSAEAANQWRSRQEEGESDEEEADDVKPAKEEDSGRRASAKGGASVSSKLSARKEQVMEPHPIQLHLDVGCEGDVSVGLTVRYLPALRCTVLKYAVSGKLPTHGSICSEESLFNLLFENDDGNCCPDLVGEAKLQHLKISVDSFASQLGRPYRFVQTLAGEGEDEKKSGVQLADVLQTVIERIRHRVAARVALVEEVRALESLKTAALKSLLVEEKEESKLKTELVSFETVSEEQYRSSLPSPSTLPAHVISAGFHFEASFENGAMKTIARILVPAGYPETTPTMAISIAREGSGEIKEQSVKDLEHYINAICLKDVSTDAVCVLSHQLYQLAARNDAIAAEFDAQVPVPSEVSAQPDEPME